MKEYSSDQEETSLDKSTVAKLTIECDSDGNISFECDYTEDDLGLTCASSILSCISSEDIGDLIIQKLSSEAKTEEEQQNVAKIKLYYDTIMKINQQNKISDDEIVISPIEAGVIG
jgi:hypothetical protein